MRQLLEQLESLTERAKRRKRGRRGRSRQGRLKKVGYKVAKGLSIPSKLLNEIAEIQGESKRDAVKLIRDVYSAEVELVIEQFEEEIRNFDGYDLGNEIKDIEFGATQSKNVSVDVDTEYGGYESVNHDFEWPEEGWTNESREFEYESRELDDYAAAFEGRLRKELSVHPYGRRLPDPDREEDSIDKVALLMSDHLRKDKKLVSALEEAAENAGFDIDGSDVPNEFREKWLRGNSWGSFESPGGDEVEYYVGDAMNLNSVRVSPSLEKNNGTSVTYTYYFLIDASVEGDPTATGEGGSKYNPNDDMRRVADYYWHNR